MKIGSSQGFLSQYYLLLLLKGKEIVPNCGCPEAFSNIGYFVVFIAERCQLSKIEPNI